MRLACMYMYAGAYFGPSRTSTVKLLCENHKKSFIVIVQMVSKYASGERFYSTKGLQNVIFV